MGSITAKRRDTEVFSMAFLDCICCGFGAVLLIFILSLIEKKDYDQESYKEIEARVKALEGKVTISQQEVERISGALNAAQIELQSLEQMKQATQLKLSDRQKEMLLMLQQTGALKDALATLLGEKKNLPTDDHAPIPIPNTDRRQYLTGFKLQGEYIVFLVRASGSMLDETVEGLEARLDDPDFRKREAPKWQRTIRSLEWMLATLDPETHFQIYFYADETLPVLTSRPDEWFHTSDRQALSEIVAKLNTVVPKGSANLERAFSVVRYLQRMPDSIVLFTDGLPTSSDSIPSDGDVTDAQREQFFRAAIRQLPPRIPVSTILMPLSGDPAGPALFWQLASYTRGALVSPARNWPEL